MKLWQCPSCNGSGGEIDVICDDGTGPQETCGFCNGKGELTRRRFFVALGYTSAWKRHEKQRKLAALRTTTAVCNTAGH
jgi:hypothetical protein